MVENAGNHVRKDAFQDEGSGECKDRVEVHIKRALPYPDPAGGDIVPSGLDYGNRNWLIPGRWR